MNIAEYFYDSLEFIGNKYAAGSPDLTKTENKASIRIHTLNPDTTLTGKKVVLYLTGGNGRQPFNESDLRIRQVLDEGYIPINLMAFPSKLSMRQRKNVAAVHDYADTSHEIDGALKLISELFGIGTEVVLFGHSRGAGALMSWLSGMCSVPSSCIIKGSIINSPAGGTNGTFYDGYHAVRALINGVNRVKSIDDSPIIFTFGSGDLTHTPRFWIENLRNNLTNEKVEIIVIGDETYRHAWPALYPGVCADMVIKLHRRDRL